MSDSNSSTDRPGGEVRLEPRCRVCRNDLVRHKVNDMLAAGASYAMIVRAVDAENSELDVRDQVTIDSVRNHSARHFPVQATAAATYRAVLERRAEENQVDFVNGVATAITPLAVLETVMIRGYEALVASDVKVDANTAMAAAAKLQALLDSRSGQVEIADIFVKQNRIIEVMKEFVPDDKIDAMLARIDGPSIGTDDNGTASVRPPGLRNYDSAVETEDDDDDW